jgi:hypothetical protein
MADSKITALTAISTVDPTADPLVIVDVSDTSMAASGTTKKSTINQLLGAGGTATLASATISGDLTVRTTGLTVNSSGVGVGLTAALGAGNIQIGAGKYLGYSASAYITPEDNVQGARIKADNILIDGNTSTKWNIGGSEAMRLNSTGLGVGASPVEKLTVAGAAEITGGVVGQGCYLIRDGASGGGTYSAKTGNVSLSAPASGTLRFNVNGGTFAGQFDVNGNLIWSPAATPPTLATNGQLTVNATSNTNLRFSYRGSDGTTRVANITLA